ncbi:hypothetical protein ACKE5C_18940 (plasmid) [Aneurinibacillus thermoaerophilus]|uniref:MerR HTH family regulatory protein n=1 Tax=Aneurinibacillus thermoaerophilus TaxID=143495 RepID=A0ABX8YGG3_ANETH|nr:hypothetical protein [Aneurinibacillus thermoaerophilus]QYY44726.1 hypothetical protein K3F53_18960 [Aneurinibacillus thermoaerophilus]
MSALAVFSVTDIAVVLGIANLQGKPHSRLVSAIISDIGISPVEKRGDKRFYDESSIDSVRRWFYHEVGIDFEKPVKVGRRYFNARYLPEDDGLSLTDLEEIVA